MSLSKYYFSSALVVSVIMTLPGEVLAATAGDGTIGGLILTLKDSVVDKLVGILLTLAILAFFFGLVKYIWGAGQGRDEGKAIMVWGVVAIFVMVSIWGLVNILQRTFLNSDDENSYTRPNVGELTPGGEDGGGEDCDGNWEDGDC
jgi:hypothetical protein